jgi:hypothetical protein
MHGGNNGGVLPHTQIVIAAPDFDVTPGIPAEKLRIRETSALAADIGEFSIASFIFDLFQSVREYLCIVH